MRLLIIIDLAVLFLSCNNLKHEKIGITKTTSAKAIMNDSLKKDILEQINLSIKSGFYNKEDAFNNVEDYLYEIPFDHNWTKQQIDSTYSERLKEQSTWAPITDFDKLAQAFDELNSSGIIALHNAGITKQDGEDDCKEIYEELQQKGIKAKGFCYYHLQDIERAVDNGNLFIGFGNFNNDDKAALEIGKKVAATLENKGIKLNWNRSVDTRIEIINIKWQKRLGNDNCSYDRAKLLLAKSKS